MSLQKIKEDHSFDKVRAYVDVCHDGQKYGDGWSYIKHLDDVVEECTGNWYWLDVTLTYKDIVRTAYLHDAKEDYAFYDEAYVSRWFGENVAQAVRDISKIPDESYDAYICKVKANPLALFVKKCDTMCNLRASVESDDKRRIKKYLKQLELLTE